MEVFCMLEEGEEIKERATETETKWEKEMEKEEGKRIRYGEVKLK